MDSSSRPTSVSTTATGATDTREDLLRSFIKLMLWTTTGALVLLQPVSTDISFALQSVAFAPFYLILCISWALLRNQRSKSAAWTLLTGTLVLQIGATVFNSTIAAQALVSFLNLILIAGFTIGRRAAVLTTSIAAPCVVIFHLLSERDELPNPVMGPGSVEAQIITVLSTILTTGGIVSLGLMHVNRALQRERDSLRQSQQNMERFIEENNARLRAEESLQRSQKMEAIGRLSAGVAHDFNNLLTVILGGTELAILKSGRNEDATEELSAIKISTERAIALTERMMAFQSSGIRTVIPVEIKQCFSDFRVVLEGLLTPEIHLVLPTLSREQWVHLERIELEQILVNLVQNARDAIEGSGRIRIEVRNEEPDVLTLLIEDDGSGMSPEVQARIFDPFFTTRESIGGHGLGLTGVYTLIEQTGGSISVDSRLGEGTIFTVKLPIAESPSKREGPADQPEMESSESSHRILLVDDDLQVRAVVERMLLEAGAEVIIAENGRHALTILHEECEVDLIISDIRMPEISGFDLLREVRHLSMKIPVILISGFSPGQPDDAEHLRPFHLLAKPFTQQQLYELIRSVMSTGPRPSIHG